MSDISANNKRIVKNTVFMYARMLLVLCVSLYTVRVVFAALGEVDYGINNVVGGVVSMFGFLTTTMSAASLRFFAYYIGKNDHDTLSRYFSVSFWSYMLLAVIAVILAETVGLWIVNNYLVIPEERMVAANWVYQCVIVSFVFNIILIPYNAIILARERMDLYAYVGIVEAVLKLAIALILSHFGSDKLILYAVLTMMVTVSIVTFYVSYDVRHFSESRVKRLWDKVIFKDIFGFSAWSLYGSVALMLRGQGINILLNMFFGPVVNAARAIAYQINSALLGFVNGFYQAVRPQLTKYYSSGEGGQMMSLAYRSSRLTFYLFYFFAVPLIIEIPYVLKLWIGNAPEMTIIFVRLVLINSIIESLAMPFKGVISSTGKIKWNELINGTIRLLNFPLAWVFLKIGYPPEITLYIAIVSGLLCHVVRLIICSKQTSLSFKEYNKESLRPIVMVGVLTPILPMILRYAVSNQPLQFIVVLVASVVSSCVFIWAVGVFPPERKQLIALVKSKIQRKVNA